MKQSPIINFTLTAFLLLTAAFSPYHAHSQSVSTVTKPTSTAIWETVRHDKHLTVRIDPKADLTVYGPSTVGEVTYTGSQKLTNRESDKLISTLRTSLSADLQNEEATRVPIGTQMFQVNLSITSVRKSHPLVNLLAIAAILIPVDLGGAKVTALISDADSGQPIAEMDASGRGQIYQVLGSLQTLGQSKIVLKHESRSIAKAINTLNARTSGSQATSSAPITSN